MSEFNELLTSWRHWLHAHPEYALEEVETAAFIAAKLREMPGMEVAEGVGKTGVIGTLKCGAGGKTVGLRADFDCIKLDEMNECAYKSPRPGFMHACGHDGHTASLLGAAKLLSESRDFNGTVRFVFQPGEEPGWGARAMIEDGLFERFPMDEMYGLHNHSMSEGGTVNTCPGGFCSAEDNFKIVIKGRGGHASQPNVVIDPLVVAAQIILALQTIVSRNTPPLQTSVVSCTELFTDGNHNAIPGTVTILGDARSYSPEISALIEKRMGEIVAGTCAAHGAGYEFEYTHEFASTINHPEKIPVIAEAGARVFGADKVNVNCDPNSGSEDFGLFLEHVPGAFAFYGTHRGDGTDAPMHNPHYDFNDDYLESAAKLYAEIARVALEK